MNKIDLIKYFGEFDQQKTESFVKTKTVGDLFLIKTKKGKTIYLANKGNLVDIDEISFTDDKLFYNAKNMNNIEKKFDLLGKLEKLLNIKIGVIFPIY